jgi:hypothetical protein
LEVGRGKLEGRRWKLERGGVECKGLVFGARIFLFFRLPPSPFRILLVAGLR